MDATYKQRRLGDMPKAFSAILCFLLTLLVLTAPMPAQAPAPPPAPAAKTLQVIGDVVAVDAESRLMTVKDAKSGENFTFVFDETSQYVQVPPGAKTLEGATPVA